VDEDDFDLDGFDEAYSPDDFSQADMDFATAVGQQTGGFGDDNTAQVIANQLAQPQVGMNRSNVRGMANYDPTFAAALDISRGLDPTGNFQGTGGLAVPSYLRPQIESGRVDARGEPIRYSSGLERFLQEDVTDFVKSGPGIAGIIGNFLSDNFKDAKNALGKMGNAVGGLDMMGIFSSDTGQKAMADMEDNVSFDQFGRRIDLGDTRQISNFPQVQIPTVDTTPNLLDTNMDMANASQFLNPQVISRGLNYFAGPQIQDFFRGVTNNPNTTIRLGPGLDMDKREVDDNIFSINIPFATG
jgi:hypothetical protein